VEAKRKEGEVDVSRVSCQLFKKDGGNVRWRSCLVGVFGKCFFAGAIVLWRGAAQLCWDREE